MEEPGPATLQPLAGASRTLSQLSEDGLLPRFLARRSRKDVPWVATVLTAARFRDTLCLQSFTCVHQLSLHLRG